MNYILNFFEKYGFLLILAFVSGLFSPELKPKLLLLDLDFEEINSVKSGSDSLKQFFWIVMFCISVLCYIRDKVNFIEIITSRGALLVFSNAILLALISSTYSNYHLISVKRIIFQIMFIWCVMFFLLSSINKGTMLEIANKYSFLIIMMIAISVLTGGAFNPHGELAGFSKSKNIMGAVLSVTIIIFHICNSFWGEWKRKQLMLIFTLLFLLALTLSKTCLALVILYFILTKLNSYIVKLFCVSSLIIISAIFIILPFTSSFTLDFWNPGLAVDPSFMTGRGFIWDNLYYDLNYFKRISFGYGYGAYFGTGEIPYFFDDKYSFLRFINSAHNGYLELMLQFGSIMSLMILAVFFSYIFSSRKIYFLSASSFIVFYNISEPAIMRDQHIVWFLTIVLCVFVSKEKKI